MTRENKKTNIFGSVVDDTFDMDAEGSEGRLNLICPRAINKYVNNKYDLEKLVESIKEDGLLNPIIVNRIDDYLENYSTQMNEYELQYYTRRKEEGFKYFIITGHRRFKAYCSLYLNDGRIVHTDEDLEEFYKEFNQRENESENIFTLNLENINPFVAIPYKIENNSYMEEANKYNKSNLEQRSIQVFEVVDNVCDEMMKLGILQEKMEIWKQQKIDEITNSRTAANILSKTDCNVKNKTLDELKEELRKLDPEYFTGCKEKKATEIADYIDNKKRYKVGVSSVTKSLNVLTLLPANVIKGLYDGNITFRQALTLMGFIKKKQDSKEHLENCFSDQFDFDTYEKEIKGEKVRTVKYTTNQVVQMIKDIENNYCTIEEVVKKLKECGMY